MLSPELDLESEEVLKVWTCVGLGCSYVEPMKKHSITTGDGINFANKNTTARRMPYHRSPLSPRLNVAHVFLTALKIPGFVELISQTPKQLFTNIECGGKGWERHQGRLPTATFYKPCRPAPFLFAKLIPSTA